MFLFIFLKKAGHTVYKIIISDVYLSVLLLLITLAGLPWIALSFKGHRNAGNVPEGHEKAHPKGPVKDVTDIGHTEFWPG